MKNRIVLLCLLLLLLQLFNQFGLSQSPKPVAKRIKIDSPLILKKYKFQIEDNFQEPESPTAVFINFDDVATGGYSTQIDPNRYGNVSFYSPFYNTPTYVTPGGYYSYPNSLIVGYVCNSYTGEICSLHTLAIDFAQNSKDISFFWGRDFSYYNGTIEIYAGNDYQLVANIFVNLPGGWTGIDLSQYGQNIRRIILRHPGSAPNTTGHIFIDNFQFTPVIPQPPIGNLETVRNDGVAVGWSLDPDNQDASNTVKFYIDSQNNANLVGQAVANIPRPDVNQSTGYRGNHGFEFSIPVRFLDGNPHTIFAYGQDLISGQPTALLPGSPKTFNLRPPVQSVVFEPVTNEVINNELTNSELDRVIGAEGQRIFPDRKFPDDTINHKRVRVKAIVGQPNVTVYFRNFDVDDPTNDPTIDDNGNDGNDNREGRIILPVPQYPPSAAGILSSSTAITNANGEAIVYFTVAKQPGDNFAIAASTDNSYLNGVIVNGTGLKDSTNNPLPTTKAKKTELLTVWRKVHLEVDSMGTVGNNLINGYTTNRVEIGQTPVWINISSPTGDLEAGRYKETFDQNGMRINYGGRMTIGNVYNLQVLDNTTNSVLVRSESGVVKIGSNNIFTLFDDDDFNDNDGLLWKGDDGEDVSWRGGNMFSETFSLLQPSDNVAENPFADAYIRPDYSWAEQQPGMNDSDVPFEVHYPDTISGNDERRKIDRYRDSKNTTTTIFERDDFWIGYILIGYQSAQNAENDPQLTPQSQGQLWVGGVTPPVNGSSDLADGTTDSAGVPRGANGTVFYIEALRDLDAGPNLYGGLPYKSRIRTAPHELGHAFGIDGDGNVPEYEIMASEGVSTGLQFWYSHINLMRWRIKSPGEGN